MDGNKISLTKTFEMFLRKKMVYIQYNIFGNIFFQINVD
jgi:hypothetical protein